MTSSLPLTAPAPAAGLPLLDRAWDISPQVSVRPESFGALLYHFGTRRLSFVKDRRLYDVLDRLRSSATARDACRTVGLDPAEDAAFDRALRQLAATDMIRERRS